MPTKRATTKVPDAEPVDESTPPAAAVGPKLVTLTHPGIKSKPRVTVNPTQAKVLAKSGWIEASPDDGDETQASEASPETSEED